MILKGVGMRNKNDNLEVTRLQNIPRHSLTTRNLETRIYQLNIGSFDHDEGELNAIINRLEASNENDSIIISISSSGGYVHELNLLENIINTRFYGRITTILNSFGYSCGALMFLIGDERIIYENSSLMFHDASMGIFGKHSDIKSQINFNGEYFDYYLKTKLRPFLNTEEIDRLFRGEEFWLNALEMCKKNIATHVNFFGADFPAETYIKYRTDKKFALSFLEGLKNTNEVPPRDLERINYELNELKTCGVDKKEKPKKQRKKLKS